jgi:hypothetical protein
VSVCSLSGPDANDAILPAFSGCMKVHKRGKEDGVVRCPRMAKSGSPHPVAGIDLENHKKEPTSEWTPSPVGMSLSVLASAGRCVLGAPRTPERYPELERHPGPAYHRRIGPWPPKPSKEGEFP